jgi:GxxExxY protein
MADVMFAEESYAIVGACMEVHRELGAGFLEPIYQEALAFELDSRGVPFERESCLRVHYKERLLNKEYFCDFLCYGNIVVECKSVKELLPDHEAQVFNYLKATRFSLGLLVNFGKPSLQHKRIVCSKYFPVS